jgi:molecular chaperone GrpE
MLPEDENEGNGAPEAANDTEDSLQALQAEISELKDRMLRALADAENTRKRAERERTDALLYGTTKFARDMLSVADNLKRALEHFPADARAQANDAVKSVLEGVEATERELQAALARHGIKQIAAEGMRFDPHLHQAIAEVPGEGKDPGTIMSVVQDGYTIGERLLRPSMVTVAKNENAGTGDGGKV